MDSRRRSWMDHVVTGVCFYYLTSLIVVLGTIFGHQFLIPGAGLGNPSDLLGAFANWDGTWYRMIVDDGYWYEADKHSPVAFFPLYPLLTTGVQTITGWSTVWCLLVVSHVALLAAFVVASAYFHERLAGVGGDAAGYALLSFGLLPATFFWRMAYSESVFVLLCVLCLYGFTRRWPPVLLALVVGLATATRPVGVALVLPFVLDLWERRTSMGQFAWRAALLVPLCMWGLAAYMIYLWSTFDEPLAFALVQENWTSRPPVPLGEKAIAWLTFEPLWSVYDSDSPCCWSHRSPGNNAFFNLSFANPIYFAAAVLAVSFGAWKRWLTVKEIALSIALMLIPYVLRSHEMCLAGMARFVSVILPLYLVAGRVLSRLPTALTVALCCIGAAILAAYAALFAAWYFLI